MIDMETYSDFKEASGNPEKEFQIIGTLNREKPIKNDTVENTVYFTFFMIDEKNNEMQVYYKDNKPQDFEKLTEIVVTGKVSENKFFASKMLLKCPSKYSSDSTPEKYNNTEYNSE